MKATRMFQAYNDFRSSSEKEIEGQKYILIADENPLEIKMISGYLETLGYRVKSAPNGTDALNMIKRAHPLMVISSIEMEGIKGYELCQILKRDSETSLIPFMFISASDSTPDRALGFQQGCDDYIMKPLDPNVLKSRVEALLRRSQKDEWSLPQIVTETPAEMPQVESKPIIQAPPAIDDFSPEKTAAEAFRAELEKKLKAAAQYPEPQTQIPTAIEETAPVPITEIKPEPLPELQAEVEPEVESIALPRLEPQLEPESTIEAVESALSYKKIAPEAKLRAEAASKLNLPSRKKIAKPTRTSYMN
jgi:DNA-binding response OmpR family regulator